MAEQQESGLRLHCGQYLGEISALCFLHLPSHLSSLPYLLAGTGSQLLLYNLEAGRLIESFHVFQGIRVHGITCGFTNCTEESLSSSSPTTRLAFEIAVFGEKKVKLFILHIQILLGLEPQDQPSQVCVELALILSLPKFTHWVLDVSFLKNCAHDQGSHCLAIGCTDNSVHVWDISRSSVILEVQSPERCLLYSMRLWGDHLDALRIASGTIFNEIIVWKVVPQGPSSCHLEEGPSSCHLEEDTHLNTSSADTFQLCFQRHKAAHICRLIGHEGSIFRIVWSSDGSTLVSVSDDRSARIWAVSAKKKDLDNQEEEAAGRVLFGHNARVWDCCISSSLIVTAGEDCTSRVWGLDGRQLKVIKEHIGRGVWRCLYDPSSSLLITAGFDSAIKVHHLPASLAQSLEGQKSKQFIDKTEIFTCQIPNSSEYIGLMDSKSEYVRCLHFTREDTIYVATNHGYLYHAKFCELEGVRWTKLVQVSEEVPIVCMDLLPKKLPKHSWYVDDWVALGDGKGNMTIVRVIGNAFTPEVDFTFTWSAGKERQLLGTYWCKTLGCRFIFTADPRGILKLWRLTDSLLSVSHTSASSNVSLTAEFSSSFGIQIMCLDASFEDEVLVCGDLRGNLVLFPLLKSLLLDTPTVTEIKVSPLCYFKGAHGISSVSSIAVVKISSNEIEICSTGGDGCICYLEYDQDQRSLEFIGMKQVKELSLIHSVFADNNNSPDDLANCSYAVGFASTDFIIWNLTTEAKVVQIPCGGWRRPHSYCLGDVPEAKNCFAFVKDEIIHIHRQWVPQSQMKIFPLNLHIQFHGREIHTLCFVCENMLVEASGKHDLFDKSSWIATGCEDGTVRLTRLGPRALSRSSCHAYLECWRELSAQYAPGVESWFTSKLLGEHVGGSAVRSICFVSKTHIIASDVTNLSHWRNRENASAQDRENPFLLISVGAKRVLTSWLLRERRLDEIEKSRIEEQNKNGIGCVPSLGVASSMSFKWLSTDMPTKNTSTHGKTKRIEQIGGITENVASKKTDAKSRSKPCLNDRYDDDWRYLAVTAFLVKCAGSRLTICFVVVACSDATLALRALVLPHRLWFDVALLVPLSSPVLVLQHVIIPSHLPSEGSNRIGNIYIVISGATDGSIAFWDLTDGVEAFVQRLSALNVEKLTNCQTRPRTGRGSQGGRWWRSLSSSMPMRGPDDGSTTLKAGEAANCNLVNHAVNGTSETKNEAESHRTICSQAMHYASSEVNGVDSSPRICEICPLRVFNNVHQSGVNCLHVSDLEDCQHSENDFLFGVISGGDDQALHYLKFDLSPLSTDRDSEIVTADINLFTKSKRIKNSFHCSQSLTKKYRIRFLYHDRITSAHSSAIKGVWTDGTWVFSTGLDQRIRCWFLEEHCKLTEQACLIISVPEPEALHARFCGRSKYEIAVAGRGMQMVDFSSF